MPEAGPVFWRAMQVITWAELNGMAPNRLSAARNFVTMRFNTRNLLI
jgi:hypothetical protein